MDVTPIEVEIYEAEDGKAPFSVAIRSFYLALALARDLQPIRVSERDIYLLYDCAFSLTLADNLDINLANHLNLAHDIRLDFDLDLDRDLTLDLALSIALALAYDNDHHRHKVRARSLTTDISRASNFAKDIDSVLANKLQQLNAYLPEWSSFSENYEQNLEIFQQWWETYGPVWTETLRQLMIENRNIGHDWKLNDEQSKLLQQYQDANLLLFIRLSRNSDRSVSRDLRQEIEETLLLPVSDIEAQNQANKA